MEVLGIDVMHNVGLLVELVAIDILDTQSYIIIKIKISTRIGEKTRPIEIEEFWRGQPSRLVDMGVFVGL